MAHQYGAEDYADNQYYYEDNIIQDVHDIENIQQFDDIEHFDFNVNSSPSPAPRNYASQRAYERDYFDDDDDIAQFEAQAQTQPNLISPNHLQNNLFPNNKFRASNLPENSQLFENDLPSQGAYTPSSQPLCISRTISPVSRPMQPPPPERGVNPRNSHGIQFKPVSTLPDMYRSIFKFGVFNAIQSRCFDTIMESSTNMVISAPTGSGKTVLFELALIRLLMQQDARDVKCVYMAPTKALCSERYRDWTAKLDPIGIKCCELTGDTVGFGRNVWGEAKNSSVIITTPEKFDSLSRNWRDHGDILSRTQLFLIDEVHILNDSRGSTLEVVASRMKTRGTSVRFMLVSATVPNIDDIATWIGNGSSSGPASVFNFGDEFRPCKLTRVVYGYPRKNQNDFSFSRTLDYKLLPLLQQHAANKPVLVFCATRKGVVGTAEVLMKEYQKLAEGKQSLPWAQPRKIDAVFHDSQLRELAAAGIGCHHAGLTIDDRRVTEDLFLKKIIRIVVATSTLAVGVNLPAHTVVVKGVKMWMNGGWQEYSDLDFIQMIGRAGRPQFDKEGVAVILCDTEQERKYKALVSGKTLLESCLHVNLSEHLNSEVGLGTITNLETAKEWLHNSFLFQRIQKNPRHYALGKADDQTWQSRIDELVETSIRELQKNQLVTDNGGGDFTSTEYGEIMSKYYIRLSTMELILKLSEKSTLRDILELISTAEEMSDLRLRAGEKQVYKKIGDHNDIRFHTKVEKASDKILVLMQAVLGGISLNSPEYKTSDSQPFLEALTVFKHAPRIARTIVEVAIAKQSGAVLKYGMELVRSLTAKAWEDRPMVLRQIEQIGEKSIKVLAQNGITTLAALRQENPVRIELLLNRRTPFGTTVLTSVRELPQFSLKIREASVSSFGGGKPVTIELNIECGLIGTSKTHSPATKGKKHKPMSLGMTGVLTLTSDNEFVDFRRIPTKALREPKCFLVTVKLTKPSQTVSTRISPDNFAGLTVTETYRPSVDPEDYPTLDTRPASYDVDAVLAGLEEDPTFWDIVDEDLQDDPSEVRNTNPLSSPKNKDKPKPKSSAKSLSTLNNQPKTPSEPIRLPNGNYQCLHSCKDKTKCRHFCCRDGLAKPPKKPHHTLPVDPSQASSTARTSSGKTSKERGLKHLETLHQQSGGLALPQGRRLKLDSGSSSSTHKANKKSRNVDLSLTDMDHNGKPEEMDMERDELPDPHEILSQQVFKRSEVKQLPQFNDSDSDLEMSIADVPLTVLDGGGDSFSSPNWTRPNSVFTHSAVKAKDSSTPSNSRRRSRSRVSSLSPSPSPVMKRARVDSRSGSRTIIKDSKPTTKPSKPFLKSSSAFPTNSKLPCVTKASFVTNHRSDREKEVPLFLDGASSSDERSPGTEAATYDDDESFAFHPNTFDIQSLTSSATPIALGRTHAPTSFMMDVDPFEGHLDKDLLANTQNEKDVATRVEVSREEDIVTEQEGNGAAPDDYDLALAEFDAWYNSEAVEKP